jgi:hypothetical protein
MCTVEERPIEIPRPTIHVTPRQTTPPSDQARGFLRPQREIRLPHIRIQGLPQPQYEIRPPYITTPLGIHVNVSKGALETRANGIFVTNINFKASSKDLCEHFSRAGRITECLLQRDRSTGRVKGNATLRYASPENIRKAVEMFDGEPFMGRRLRVRLDRVFAVSNPPLEVLPQVDGGVGEGDNLRQSMDEDRPVIVDGSKSMTQDYATEWNDKREDGGRVRLGHTSMFQRLQRDRMMFVSREVVEGSTPRVSLTLTIDPGSVLRPIRRHPRSVIG